MTRFDANTPDGRHSLVADAIAAHRERGSVFCTVEAESPPNATPDGVPGDPEAEEADERQESPAWIQFSEPESQLNLDCTDEEYDRVTEVLATAPAFTIAEQATPEDAEGRNLRITARADADRIAQVVDRVFVEGFDYDGHFRLWATEI